MIRRRSARNGPEPLAQPAPSEPRTAGSARAPVRTSRAWRRDCRHSPLRSRGGSRGVDPVSRDGALALREAVPRRTGRPVRAPSRARRRRRSRAGRRGHVAQARPSRPGEIRLSARYDGRLEIGLDAVGLEQPIDDCDGGSLTPRLGRLAGAREQVCEQGDRLRRRRRSRPRGAPRGSRRAGCRPPPRRERARRERSDSREGRRARQSRGDEPIVSDPSRARAWRARRAPTPSARAVPRQRRARVASPQPRRSGRR